MHLACRGGSHEVQTPTLLESTKNTHPNNCKFGVQGSLFGVQGSSLGFKVPGSGFRVSVPASGFRVPVSGFRDPGSRFRRPFEDASESFVPNRQGLYTCRTNEHLLSSRCRQLVTRASLPWCSLRTAPDCAASFSTKRFCLPQQGRSPGLLAVGSRAGWK